MLYLCNGEVSAFDELYMRYSKRLLGYFIRMLNFDKELAQDALQDLFLKIAETPESFDRERSFKTWIFSVAANRCKNYYRHKKIVEEAHSQVTYIEEQIDEHGFIKLAAKIDSKKFIKTLHDTLNELPVEKKEAFILKYQEEKTLSEIAYIQNCPEGSVKSRLHYTLKTLEEKLKLFNPVN
jgi:RNA polymerase sigma-70 factor (ECF subfamily)